MGGVNATGELLEQFAKIFLLLLIVYFLYAVCIFRICSETSVMVEATPNPPNDKVSPDLVDILGGVEFELLLVLHNLHILSNCLCLKRAVGWL